MIEGYTNQSVSIANKGVPDNYGDAVTYGSPVTVAARMEMVTRWVMDPLSGQKVLSSARVYVDPVTVAPGSRVTYGTATYHVIAVEQMAASDGSVGYLRLDLGG